MKKIILFVLCLALFACTDEPMPVKVESVKLNQDELTLMVDDEYELKATVLPEGAENKSLYWSSSKNDVAAVEDGLVTALSPGTTTITAISDDGGKKATCVVVVVAKPVPVTGVTLDKEDVRLFLGHEMTLNATISPADATNKALTWNSSDNSVVTVTEGLVKAVGLGDAVVTVTTDDGGFSAECSIRVTEECQTQTKGPMTLDLGEVTATTVIFNASLDVNLMTDYQEVGFVYSTDRQLDVESDAVTKVRVSREDFSERLTGLLYDTEYYYAIYLLKNGVYQYGETQKFKTDDYGQSDYNMGSATDLSSSTSANCYIVSASGLYKFKTVKGNSSESVGSVASASILWETFGTSVTPDYLDLVDGVCCKDGYIAFQTADTFKEGNAVIAAKDFNGNILWSWHIWLTDQPQAQVYNNDAGTMMDRNLGATSATPGNVGALGLLYQWGRKDPFLNSSSISDNKLAKSTITWPSAVSTSSSVGTVEYVISHPTTFVTASSSTDYDWHYSSRENTLWTTSESEKSIYDPCPAGWRVPDGGSNGVWEMAGFDDTTYNSTNEGMSFSISSPSTTWYPASGCRSNNGSLSIVGSGGDYWSASPYSDDAYALVFSHFGGVSPSYDSARALGQSVRCLQESK